MPPTTGGRTPMTDGHAADDWRQATDDRCHAADDR